jgi:hypothetical protein
MNVKAVRSWLLVRPRGTRLTLKTGEARQDVEIESDQNWTRLAESVETVDPDTIEIYASDGKLLRAAKRGTFDEPDDDETENEAAKRIKAAADAETERFRIFSDHLANAYRFATEVAFERMVDLFAAVNRRSESLEKSLDATHRLLGKAYQEQVDTALDHAENADPLSSLVGAFVQGGGQAAMENAAAQAAAQAKTNGQRPTSPSNGKGKAQA